MLIAWKSAGRGGKRGLLQNTTPHAQQQNQQPSVGTCCNSICQSSLVRNLFMQDRPHNTPDRRARKGFARAATHHGPLHASNSRQGII